MKPRVYIDTSVVGGYFDEEFAEITKRFFERVFAGDFLIFFSEISETELFLAPDYVRDLKIKIPIGYPTIDIRSPLEFTGDENNN